MPFQNEANLRNKNGSQTGQGVLGFGDVTTIATAGAVTYTARQILDGLILRDPAGGARSDVVPTAASIIAQIQAPRVGEFFYFVVRNTADANETITLDATGATGTTLSGTMTIGQNNSKLFRAQITAVATPAVTIYSIGTFVH